MPTRTPDRTAVAGTTHARRRRRPTPASPAARNAGTAPRSTSRVDPDDDFFALGGHSMLAVRMASRFRTELGLRVPVRTILENPTVDGLSRLLAEAVESATDPAGS
jgi:aryl carrier-like protein